MTSSLHLTMVDNMAVQIKRFFQRNSLWLNKNFTVYPLIISVIFVLVLLGHSSQFIKVSNSKTIIRTNKAVNYPKGSHVTVNIPRPKNGLKFILLWTDPDASPFLYFDKGQDFFKKKSCRYTNCYVTADKNYLGDYVLFDAVLFNGPQLPSVMTPANAPVRRSPSQKYVYANMESCAKYPMCTKVWNGFFNWTWTYRLDSDYVWGYFAVRNATNNVVAPKMDVQWINADHMADVEDKLKASLKSKTKAAAWFSSNSKTQSRREHFITKLRRHLKNFSLDVDVYGECEDHHHQYPRNINERCKQMLRKKYYFYLAFENALSSDYVTEKILYAYLHNTVPIVYGGANYSRFIPNGTYLNAYEMGPEKLARTMNELIKDPQKYYKFFRWKKYYSFHYRHESPETDDYCNFCALLNDKELINKKSVVGELDWWWNDNNTCYKNYYHTIDDFDYVYQQGVE